MDEYVQITRIEYEQLLGRDEWLSCLEQAGVDSWAGWDDAVEISEQDY